MDTYTLLNVSEKLTQGKSYLTVVLKWALNTWSVCLRDTPRLGAMSKWHIHVHVLGYFYCTYLWNKYTIVIVPWATPSSPNTQTSTSSNSIKNKLKHWYHLPSQMLVKSLVFQNVYFLSKCIDVMRACPNWQVTASLITNLSYFAENIMSDGTQYAENHEVNVPSSMCFYKWWEVQAFSLE